MITKFPRNLASICAKTNIATPLHSVRLKTVEPGELQAEATDGTMLARITMPNHDPITQMDALIPADDWRRAFERAKKSDLLTDYPCCEWWPPSDDLFRENDAEASITVDLNRLATLVAVLQKSSGSKSTRVTLRISEPDKPLTLTAGPGRAILAPAVWGEPS